MEGEDLATMMAGAINRMMQERENMADLELAIKTIVRRRVDSMERTSHAT